MCAPHTFVRLIGDILRAVDVQEPGNSWFGGPAGRRRRRAVARMIRLPHANAGGRLICCRPTSTGLQIVQRRERVVARIDHAGVRVEQREAWQARQVGRRR